MVGLGLGFGLFDLGMVGSLLGTYVAGRQYTSRAEGLVWKRRRLSTPSIYPSFGGNNG